MSGLRLSLIAAVARNGVIGTAGHMPWRLSTDLRRFKRLTMGKPIVMGRKTFASIGKPLSGRANIVLTRQGGTAPEGAIFVSDLDGALEFAATQAGMHNAGEVMVIGGGQVYAAAIDRADRLYITHVEATPEGDTHFPQIDPAAWKATSSEHIGVSETDTAPTTFVIYERIAPGAG